MKRLLVVSILVIIAAQVSAVDKSAFDLVRPKLQKATGTAEADDFGDRLLRNDTFELTLVSGGYFTIGTVNGRSPSPLDDHCGITFGHPYATTSYPLLCLDGVWQKFDELLADYGPMFPGQKGDTLIISGEKAGLAGSSFALILSEDGHAVELILRYKNLDAIEHSMGMGLVIDPALGLWGDGCLALNGGSVSNDTLLTAPSIPDRLLLWERAEGTRGLGAGIYFADKPDKIVLANWADIYDNPAPRFEPSELRKLYDLALKMIWSERTIAPNKELTCKLSISVEDPDFSSPAFMRWDMPSFLSLENGLLFPQQMPTYVQISDVSGGMTTSGTLSVESESPLSITPAEKSISLSPAGSIFESLEVQSQEIYEDKIAETSLRLVKDNVVIDELRRNVFIPATPVSDTGLVVTIDTVMTPGFPQIELMFGARVQATDYLITNLSRNNVLLFENEARIQEFTMGKDTTGGVHAADIVFVLDVTGSMSDEIDAVKNNIVEFADSLSRRGVDYRLGMVTFLDDIENIFPFTNDVQTFQQLVAQQNAHGGGDRPENSLEALNVAAQYAFRAKANRIVIWITDANYHESDSVTPLTKQEVINALLAKDITVHTIGSTSDKTSSYDPIINPCGGNFYSIQGNFRDILLDISRMKATGRYLISYKSPNSPSNTNQIRLKVHYAGLGGYATDDYMPFSRSLRKNLVCYPNPFNPATNILISNLDGLHGEVDIFNIVGQRVKHFSIQKEAPLPIVWNARDEHGLPVGTGFYIVQLSLFDQKGNASREVEKILYLK